MTHDHDSSPATPIAGTPDCERALAEVYAFLDAELNETQRNQIMTHLEACSPCFEAFDFEAERGETFAHHIERCIGFQIGFKP